MTPSLESASPVASSFELSSLNLVKHEPSRASASTRLFHLVISAVSDFAFAAFPILLLWKLQMKLRTKFALCLLMGLGVM